MMTVECDGSGHLTVISDGQVEEVQAGPRADAWLMSHGLTWDDVDHGRPVPVEE